MKKRKYFLIVFTFLFNSLGLVFGQPNPNDVGYGSGNAVPVGGGADLGPSFVWLILIAIIYTILKFKMKIIHWVVKITS